MNYVCVERIRVKSDTRLLKFVYFFTTNSSRVPTEVTELYCRKWLIIITK